MATLHDNKIITDTAAGTLLANTGNTLAVTLGDKVTVFYKHEGAADVPTIDDDGANSWVIDGAYTRHTNNDLAAIAWSCVAKANASLVISIHSASRSFRHAEIASWTPTSLPLVLDATQVKIINTGNDALPNAGSAGTALAAGLSLGLFGMYGARQLTPGGAWTEPSAWNISNNVTGEYQLQTGSGSITVDGTFDSSVEYVGMLLIYNEILVATTEEEGFRARNDDGSETTASFAAAQDTNFTFPIDTNLRLRMLLNATNDPASTAYKLEYKLNADSTYVPLLVSAPSFPTFQAAGAEVSGTGAVTPLWPTHVAGDIALLFIESCGGEAATLTTASGFAAVANSPQNTGTTTLGTRVTVFWCRATSATMAAPVVGDPGDHVYARILTFRSCIAEGNPWDVTGGGVKAVASTSLSATGITTTVNNCLIVIGISRDTDSAAAAFSAEANASLASIVEQVDSGTTSGNGGGICVVTGTLATAGASGTLTATVSSSINTWLAIALRPQTTPLMMSASANITASGDATTAQLTPPAGKTTSNFTTGRMWDDENGTDSIDIASGNYTELEWCIKALSVNGAANAQVYNLRVSANGVPLDTYTLTPAWTIGSAATPSFAPIRGNRGSRLATLMRF